MDRTGPHMRVDEDGVAVCLADMGYVEHTVADTRTFKDRDAIRMNPAPVESDSVDGDPTTLRACDGTEYPATLQPDRSVRVIVDCFENAMHAIFAVRAETAGAIRREKGRVKQPRLPKPKRLRGRCDATKSRRGGKVMSVRPSEGDRIVRGTEEGIVKEVTTSRVLVRWTSGFYAIEEEIEPHRLIPIVDKTGESTWRVDS